MTSFGNYDATRDGADDSISPFASPFLARDEATEGSAGAVAANSSLADMANMSGSPAPARHHHHGSSFGYPYPLQQFGDFPYHVNPTDSALIGPSQFDQLALAYSPLASPVGFPGLSVAGAGYFPSTDGTPFPSPLPLTQPSPWPQTSPETHAWISDNLYRSGPSYIATANPLNPSGAPSPVSLTRPYPLGSLAQANQTSHMLSPADYSRASASIWDPGPSVAGKASAVTSSQEWSSTGKEGASPEKVRRRRGRPRIYEDEGIELPKRKPGRLLTYAPVPDSFGSRSSITSSMSNISPSSADGSGAAGPFWEGTSSSLSARSGKRNQPDDELTEQDPAEAAAQAVIRHRNKAAATRYRLKIQKTVDRMEAEEREASLRRQALLACADRLRGEVNSLKTEVMQHANCGCPYISGYMSAATQEMMASMGASTAPYASVSPSAPQHLPAGVSAGLDLPLSYSHVHLASCLWQQGSFAMANPSPVQFYDEAPPSASTFAQSPTDVDGYFQPSTSSSNAESR